MCFPKSCKKVMFVNNLMEKYEITLGENICRFCLRTDKVEMQNIFLENTLNIEELCAFASIKITKTDELPENACTNCISSIQDCLTFRLKIQESDKVLRSSGVLVAIQEIPPTLPAISESIELETGIDQKLDLDVDNLLSIDEQREDVNPLQKLILDLDITEEFEDGTKTEDKAGPVKPTQSEGKSFVCPVCSKTFELKCRLEQHLTIHGDCIVPCPICEKKFKNTKYMHAHMKTHNSTEQFFCDTCGKKFNSKSNLRKHEKIQHGDESKSNEKKFTCHICSKDFVSSWNLKCHLETHKDKREEFICKVCNKTFSSKSILKKHSSTHSDGPVFKCEKCDKEFKQLKNLNEHSMIHSDDKKFKCPMCEKKFLKNHQMKVHIKSHTNEKDIPCPMCNMKFSQKGNMRRHLSAVHKKNNITE